MSEYVTASRGPRMWPFQVRDVAPNAEEQCVRLAEHLEGAVPGMNDVLDRLLHKPGTEKQAKKLAEIARLWSRRNPA